MECEFCSALLIDAFQKEDASTTDPIQMIGGSRTPSADTDELLRAAREISEDDDFWPRESLQRFPNPNQSTGDLPRLFRFGNRYQIVEKLGEGGMGRVYKALDLELDRAVALKTIRGEKSSSPEILERFKQELILARKVTHKNVIRIYDLGEFEGMKFFTMELVEGANLREVLDEKQKVPVAETLSFMKQMLSGLAEAHSQGVIHRDPQATEHHCRRPRGRPDSGFRHRSHCRLGDDDGHGRDDGNPRLHLPRASWTSSSTQPDYRNISTTPLVADLTGDGVSDIVFVTFRAASTSVGYLRAVDGATRQELFTADDFNWRVYGHATPAIGDLDGNGDLDIVAIDDSRRHVMAFEWDTALSQLSFKWKSVSLPDAVNLGAVSIADLEGDGQAEILFGRQVLESDGTLRFSGSSTRRGHLISSLSVAVDLDDDGLLELVTGDVAYTGAGAATGDVFWDLGIADGFVAVGNFDTDPDPEPELVHLEPQPPAPARARTRRHGEVGAGDRSRQRARSASHRGGRGRGRPGGDRRRHARPPHGL